VFQTGRIKVKQKTKNKKQKTKNKKQKIQKKSKKTLQVVRFKF